MRLQIIGIRTMIQQPSTGRQSTLHMRLKQQRGTAAIPFLMTQNNFDAGPGNRKVEISGNFRPRPAGVHHCKLIKLNGPLNLN